MKTFADYEQWRATLDFSPKDLSYPTLGINGEAGEISDKIINLLICGAKAHIGASKVAERVKKVIRDQDSQIDPETKRLILLECGDVLWYLAAIAQRLNSSLEEVALLNFGKLESRRERGTLQGSGDDR